MSTILMPSQASLPTPIKTRKPPAAEGTNRYWITMVGVDDSQATIRVHHGDIEAAQFNLIRSHGMPFFIVNALYIDERHRGFYITVRDEAPYAARKFSDILDDVKIAFAKENGEYGLLASVRSDNTPELARLFKSERWRQVHYTREHHIFVLNA